MTEVGGNLITGGVGCGLLVKSVKRKTVTGKKRKKFSVRFKHNVGKMRKT